MANINDDSQNNSDLPEGFLIKDKNGQFRKVQGGQVVGFDVVKKSPKPVQNTEKAILNQPFKALNIDKQINIPVSAAPSSVFTPQAPISASPKAAYFVAPDDEEEIRQHAAELKKISTVVPVDEAGIISASIEKIIRSNNISFADEVMRKRFAKIIESRLHEIRDALETREVLGRPKKIGGLEIPEQMLDKVMDSVEAEVKNLKQAGWFIAKTGLAAKPAGLAGDMAETKKIFSVEPPPFVPRPHEAAQAAEQTVGPAKQPVIEESPEKLSEEIKKELAAVAKPPVTPTPQPPVARPSVKPAQVESIASAAPLYTPAPAVARPRRLPRNEQAAERPQVVDIKQPVQVMGPVEELGSIDVKEYRRLGSSPDEAAAKVMDKINLLAEDSWQFKLSGMKAWKSSPTQKLYVEIGRESIESNQSVDDVVKKRQGAGLPFLTLEEFYAINNLNSQLEI